jgi:hypothetical protein
MLQLDYHDPPIRRILLHRPPHAHDVAAGPRSPRPLPLREAPQLTHVHRQRVAAPDGEQALPPCRGGQLQVDAHRAASLDGGGVAVLDRWVEKVQVTCGADVEDGQVAGPVRLRLQPQRLAGSHPRLRRPRRHSPDIAAQGVGRRLRGRHRAPAVCRPPADLQPQTHRRRCRPLGGRRKELIHQGLIQCAPQQIDELR